MALKDLITSGRAAQNMSSYGTPPDTTGLLQVLVTACSDAIEKYCRRRFVSRDFDECYNGDGEPRLLLREYPVQSIQSVRYRPTTVLKISNTDATNVQARVSVTSLGLKLFRFQAGARFTDSTCLFTANPTLSRLAAAVNALGNGWSAQVVGDSTNYGAWPSADLYLPGSYGDPIEGNGIQESQGGLSMVVGSAAGSSAELKMHTYELQGYQWDVRGWLLRAIPYTDPDLMHPEDLVFPPGINNFRIQYTAGYSTIPEAVQEACATWVAEKYFNTQRDPLLRSQLFVAGAAGSVQSQGWGGDSGSLPTRVKQLLAPYRRVTISTNQG